MITIIPYETLGKADYGWLKANHHFSFANYYNPDRMGFGVLRVINDDQIAAGTGFDTHPHRNMEIITFVRKGAITHRDNMGHEGRTEAGDLQVMSAGKGVFHSEYNLESEDTSLFQIWIEPREKNVEPSWDSKSFPKEKINGHIPLLVSGNAEDDALFIHQDAEIYGGKLEAGHSIDHAIKRQAYLLVSDGEIELNERKMSKGDGAEIRSLSEITIKALNDAEILILDVPEA